MPPTPAMEAAETSRSWQSVGQHMRFTARWEALAATYLRDVFGLTANADIPPFIAVHIRRGDFEWAHGFTGVEKFRTAVDRVRQQLAEHSTKASSVESAFERPGHLDWHTASARPLEMRVVVTTDSEDPVFVR
jgi:hypothetical protein